MKPNSFSIADSSDSFKAEFKVACALFVIFSVTSWIVIFEMKD